MTDDPTLSDVRATSPHELAWTFRDGTASVALPTGRVEAATWKPPAQQQSIDVRILVPSRDIELAFPVPVEAHGHGKSWIMVHAHEAVPELATLMALCGALAALPRAASHPLSAGLAFGLAIGAALLSSHWVTATALFIAVVAAHLVCPAWRTRSAVLFLAVSALVAGVLAAAWPFALASRSTELFAGWWAATAQPQGSFVQNLRYFFGAGSGFGWPGPGEKP